VQYWARSRRTLHTAEVYVLKGKDQYYQVLGHAWDHEAKDFVVIYRPLYHCGAKTGSFEAHVLASTKFARWDAKFEPVSAADMPSAVQSWLLPGPFCWDPIWTHPWRSAVLPRGVRSRSGHNCTRSHEPPALDDVIGSVAAFIDACHEELVSHGFDAVARGCEMDHICFRTETRQEYQDVLSALVPQLGHVLVESMIGGRPIATVALHQPIEHAGYRVMCIEVPCPKEGSPYRSGLEHAELVVGVPTDGVEGNTRLLAFMEQCKRDQGITLSFQVDALHKAVNADVSHTFALADGRKGTIKFHTRPLNEVVAWEKRHNAVVAVPPGYFE